jgi:hypothetical protein
MQYIAAVNVRMSFCAQTVQIIKNFRRFVQNDGKQQTLIGSRSFEKEARKGTLDNILHEGTDLMKRTKNDGMLPEEKDL